MKNKKGFTLIELLAVIVVLGIILAIAIPKITETIANSKEAAFKTSVKSLIRSGEQYAITNKLKNGAYGTIDQLEVKNTGNLEGNWSYNDKIFTIDHIKSIKDENQEFYNVNINNIDTEGTKVGNAVVYNTPDKTYYTIENGIDGVQITNGILSGVYNNSNNKNIIIPDSVSAINDNNSCYTTFSTKYLDSVILPSNLTIIGRCSFHANNLTNVTIPNSVTSIGFCAFCNNKLTNVTIPNSVTSIDVSTFENNQLTSVKIPDSVTSIGSWAFYYNQLTSVTIPNSVTSIGTAAFSSNPNLTEIIMEGRSNLDGMTLGTGWNGVATITYRP